MKVLFFDTHPFEKNIFERENENFHHDFTFLDARLTPQTALLSKGFTCVCCFANDQLNSDSLSILKNQGVRLIALRSAGFNHVDLVSAKKLKLKVVRVPEYSPYAIAEHAVCLILALNRKIHRAYQRVHELNFSLDGLVGYDIHKKTVGIIGTGRIGSAFAHIMKGFGCKILAYDISPNLKLSKKCGAQYVSLEELYKKSNIISLHIPLTPQTKHLIDKDALDLMSEGTVLINTSRGALIDSHALINSLKSGHIGAAGLDVYEEEENIFFKDMSDQILQDDILARLLTFPNVLITSHQAFLTREALGNIAQTTLQNISDFERSLPLKNEVSATKSLRPQDLSRKNRVKKFGSSRNSTFLKNTR